MVRKTVLSNITIKTNHFAQSANPHKPMKHILKSEGYFTKIYMTSVELDDNTYPTINPLAHEATGTVHYEQDL